MTAGIPHEINISGSLKFLALFILLFLSLGKNAQADSIALVEPRTLNKEKSKWVILDARPKSEWLAGHIPGALSFSWEDYTRTDEKGIPYRVFPPDELSSALGEMGIDEKTPIVIYGDADKSWGGEGWSCWTLAWLGHEGPVRLLTGGIQAWRSNNLPVTADTKRNAVEKVKYNFKMKPRLDITTAEIEREKSSIVLIDTRSTMEWLMGGIPGAIHIQWTEFYSGKERRPLEPASLKKLLKDHGVDTNKTVVYYCKGGVRSAYAWTVHQLSGLPDARNYEGGMEAWQKSR